MPKDKVFTKFCKTTWEYIDGSYWFGVYQYRGYDIHIGFTDNYFQKENERIKPITYFWSYSSYCQCCNRGMADRHLNTGTQKFSDPYIALNNAKSNIDAILNDPESKQVWIDTRKEIIKKFKI